MRNVAGQIADTTEALRFGKLAVKNGFVTRDQLDMALSEQIANDPSSRLRPHRLLGEIFFEKGWMKSKEIEVVLKELFSV